MAKKKTAEKPQEKKKQSKEPVASNKEVRAIAKFVRQSPFKLRRVADLIRNKNAVVSLATLKQMPHRGAENIYKVLKSAIANAENNEKQNPQDLVITRILINEGPRQKRFQPKAKGRIYQIIKRTSHIEVAVKPAGGQ